jgi:uncharacterized protein
MKSNPEGEYTNLAMRAYIVFFSFSSIISCASSDLSTNPSKSQEKRGVILSNETVVLKRPNPVAPTTSPKQNTNPSPPKKLTSQEVFAKEKADWENQKDRLLQNLKKKEADIKRKQREYDTKMSELGNLLIKNSELKRELKQKYSQYMPKEEWEIQKQHLLQDLNKKEADWARERKQYEQKISKLEKDHAEVYERQQAINKQNNKKGKFLNKEESRAELEQENNNYFEPKIQLPLKTEKTTSDKPETGHPKPSFECQKASNWIEVTVCGSSKLAALDQKMSQFYNEVMKSKETTKEKRSLKRNQQSWLNSRFECIKTGSKKVECVERLYLSRINWLKIFKEKKQHRFSGRKTLFEILPIGTFKLYNKHVVMDKANGLLWTKRNFSEKEHDFPAGPKECKEWAEQMNLEKYGGINNWKIPNYEELSLLNNIFQNVMAGKSENLRYWGIKESNNKKMGIFYFNSKNIPKAKDFSQRANCRLVSKLSQENS